MHATSTTVEASYSCRIGLASNLASTVATSWNEAGFMANSFIVESVVLQRDQPSQRPASSLSPPASHPHVDSARSSHRPLSTGLCITTVGLAQTLWTLVRAACCRTARSDRLTRTAAGKRVGVKWALDLSSSIRLGKFQIVGFKNNHDDLNPNARRRSAQVCGVR